MAKTKKAQSFKELGNLIESWRSAKYRSALAFFKEVGKKKFSFSYYAYVDFEKGDALPSVDALLELAKFFGADEVEAVLIWTKAQMPKPELKKVFQGRREQRQKIQSTDADTLPPSFENTWVYGAPERKALLEAPWLAPLLASLAMFHPDGLRWGELNTPAGVTEGEIRERLKHAIESGNIIADAKGLRLKHPHLHMPKTPEWNDVRASNLKFTLDALTRGVPAEMLEQGLAYREMVRRPLTSSQAKRWVSELRRFEQEFKADLYVPEDKPEAESTYAWVAALGPQKLRK